MLQLKHDDIKSGADLEIQAGDGSRTRIWRIGEWLGRVVGRGCATGLWTLSPDGKLRCESLRAEPGDSD
jgi:hypothetical protein